MKAPDAWQRALPYILLVGGLVGLLASFMLTYDKIQVLQDPSYSPGCNLNPVLSCGSVMQAAQASLFGVPNTIFGLAAFSMLTMLGMVLLAGAQLKQWFWRLVQVAAVGGLVFAGYLFFQSVFRIGAICPWCFVVWMATIPVFLSITIYNLRAGNLGVSNKVATWVQQNGVGILVVWYLLVFATLLVRFWYFWRTLLGV